MVERQYQPHKKSMVKDRQNDIILYGKGSTNEHLGHVVKGRQNICAVVQGSTKATRSR